MLPLVEAESTRGRLHGQRIETRVNFAGGSSVVRGIDCCSLAFGCVNALRYLAIAVTLVDLRWYGAHADRIDAFVQVELAWNASGSLTRCASCSLLT